MEQPRVIYQPFKRLKMALRSKKRKRSSITMGGRDNDTGLALLHLHVSLCQVATGDAIRRDDALSRDRRTFLYSSPLPADEGAFLSGKHKCMLCLRGLFGSIALFFYFLSIEGLTLGDSQILSQLAAFFMCLLSPIFLKEKLPRQAIPGMLSIAIGTLCVVQIWNFNAFNMYTLFGIGGGFFSAAAYVVISCLAEKGFRSNTEIVFYFQIFSILVGLSISGNESWILPQGRDWFFVIGLGLFALSAQMFMTWAFQHVNSLVVSFLMYSEILFHVIFGWAFWDEIMAPASWLGGALIVAGSIMLMVFKPKRIDQDTHHRSRQKQEAGDAV